ncbi:MAG: DNA mismatch repair protein MutT [Bacteroidales bacterium]|nr:DNA mismatch repair protein MutT [Bacteroidales bacterium]MDD3166145.1 DNA mismatch repair protein MutT [Bacteroidales bacterium]MDD4769859.1 DNA mismatch repair protein MutT [Bacteroidales bacterium]
MYLDSIYPHVSVDCVILGFDGNQFHVLLMQRTGLDGSQPFNDMKLPGRLIYANEDLDAAAQQIMNGIFPSAQSFLTQFKCFGSQDRTANPRDVHWLENAVKQKIGRIVTVAYLNLVRISDAMHFASDTLQAKWVPVKEVGSLAFDHNTILLEAMQEVRKFVNMDPYVVFNLLPKKFTASQMRTLFEQLFDQKMDVRNFSKKMSSMDFVVPLDEYEQNVAHRAARYYRFDRKLYIKSHGGFSF